jgi:outer membrane protein assembly factor BamD
MRARQRFARPAMALMLLALAGCGGSEQKAYIEKPVDDLYNKAMDDMANGYYRTAAQGFDDVESQHPYSVWATKAQIMSAYALYRAGDYNRAIIAANDFIRLNPGDRDAPYAYYLKALCYYVQIADVGRDQKVTAQALSALQQVVRRYPNSKYAEDAKLKIDFTHDHLAAKEMAIGRYYLNRGNYLAAMNRFKRVIARYQTTSDAPEALERLVECDLALGLTSEAKKNAAVLGYNYPGSRWYAHAYALVTGKSLPAAAGAGWFSRLFGKVL